MVVAIGGFAILACWSDGGFRYGVGLTIAEIAAAAFILALNGARIPAPLAWPARALAALGTIAYSLYLWHASIARVVEGMAPAIGSPGLVLLAKYAAAIGWATLMFVAVERPAMRWRDAKGPERLWQSLLKILRTMCNKDRNLSVLPVAEGPRKA